MKARVSLVNNQRVPVYRVRSIYPRANIAFFKTNDPKFQFIAVVSLKPIQNLTRLEIATETKRQLYKVDLDLRSGRGYKPTTTSIKNVNCTLCLETEIDPRCCVYICELM